VFAGASLLWLAVSLAACFATIDSVQYSQIAIPDDRIPRSTEPLLQHVLDTYASETNKVISTWTLFDDADLGYRPAEKSATVGEIMKHQLLSERRFFAQFLGMPEPPAAEVLPVEPDVDGFARRMLQLAEPRLAILAGQSAQWWSDRVPFFDVNRERIWIFWRRVLHTAHHRTQLTVYLRLLGKTVPSTYGPTADVTWDGADPTTTIQAASR
jgi:uncharacterized damage-inducible protein DinB